MGVAKIMAIEAHPFTELFDERSENLYLLMDPVIENRAIGADYS